MSDLDHFRALENMYRAAPINAIFKPRIHIDERKAEISIEVSPALFHSAGAVHGSVYFKMLDDAAFFAASSIVPRTFVLTTSFTTYLTRPVSAGRIRSVGKVVNATRTQLIAESVLYNEQGKELGRGSGIFVRGKTRLVDAIGYGDGKTETAPRQHGIS